LTTLTVELYLDSVKLNQYDKYIIHTRILEQMLYPDH